MSRPEAVAPSIHPESSSIASLFNGRLSLANERHGKEVLIEAHLPLIPRFVALVKPCGRKPGFGADCVLAPLPMVRCGRTVSRGRLGWRPWEKVIQVFPFERGQFVIRDAESYPPPSDAPVPERSKPIPGRTSR